MRILFNNQLFDSPATVIKCYKLSDVIPCLAGMEKALAKGFYLAGFLSYEAGYAFEKCFANNKTYEFPLVSFGVYKTPHPLPRFARVSPSPFKMERGTKGVRFREYLSTIRKIKHYLASGDTYQVNYTFKLKFDFSGSPFALYQKLRQRQPTPFSAYVEDDDYQILSLSPELFFHKQKNKIIVKPMKGTVGKGKGNRQRLQNDKKNQAENLMIVDLLRNDLGRIAKPGTVKTVKLFEVEKHPTLYQMTSTIKAEINQKIPLPELFRNIFPSGSVTGAPKIRTMQIIKGLEKEERRIYTGTIGYITPERDMLFNVAIRTLLLRNNLGEMGIGSGITFDSDPTKELEECLLKADFALF